MEPWNAIKWNGNLWILKKQFCESIFFSNSFLSRGSETLDLSTFQWPYANFPKTIKSKETKKSIIKNLTSSIIISN